MIKTQNLTPEIYYRESRDFQYFGRIYDILFNYVKTNVDLMKNFPINQHTDSKLIELLTRTLGFENKSNYRNDDLNAICSVFIELIKNKGTTYGIELLIKTILNTAQIKDKYSINIHKENFIPVIDIQIPDIVYNTEVRLLEDVLEYIIPAGCLYTITSVKISEADKLTLSLDSFTESRSILFNNNSQISDGTNITTNNKVYQSGTNSGNQITNPKVGDIRFSRMNREK